MDVINRFRGRYDYLSNFSLAWVEFERLPFRTAEHAFVAGKTTDMQIRRWISQGRTVTDARGQKYNLTYPGPTKRYGKTIELRDSWNSLRDGIMLQVLRDKFRRNPKLRRKLLQTGIVQLVEGNYWHDNYWGICFCEKCYGIHGENRLGETLMQVRSEFRQQENALDQFRMSQSCQS